MGSTEDKKKKRMRSVFYAQRHGRAVEARLLVTTESCFSTCKVIYSGCN